MASTANSTATSFEIKIKRFSGKEEDFPNWKREFKFILQSKGLDFYLDEDDLQQAIADKIVTKDKSLEMNRQLYAALCLSLDNTTVDKLELRCRNDGLTGWNELLKIFEKKNLLKINQVRNKLTSTILQEDGDVEIYVNNILTYIQQLNDFGEKIPESSIISIILGGLPESLKHWVFYKNSENKKKALTLPEVIDELIDNAEFQKDKLKLHSKHQIENDNVVFSAINHNNIKFTGNCNYCGKPGHQSTKCFNNPSSSNFRSNKFSGRKKVWNNNNNQHNKNNYHSNNYHKNNGYNKNNNNQNRNNNNYYGNNNSYGNRNNNDHNRNNNQQQNNASNNTNSNSFQNKNNKQNYTDDIKNNHISINDDEDDEINDLAFMINTSNNKFTKSNSTAWVIDSGCTAHMCNDKNMFNSIQFQDNCKTVGMANGIRTSIKGIGEINLVARDSKNNEIIMRLSEVLFIPELDTNFLSVKILDLKGHSTTFSNGIGKINILKQDKRFILAQIEDNLYTIRCSYFNNNERVASVTENKDLELWHKRMGHVNYQMLSKLPNKVIGMEVDSSTTKLDSTSCDTCITSKMVKKPFTSNKNRATRKLERVYSDVAGPSRTKSLIEEHRYAINFIDDNTRYTALYTLKNKSDALKFFQKFIAEHGHPNELEIGGIRSDNGGEYTSEQFQQFCLDNKIKREFTIPHTPQQNGVAERNWRTLFDMTRSMLKEANLDSRFWARALKTAVFIRNRCLTSANHQQITPYELFFGKKPDLSRVRIFGCKAFVYNDDTNRGKLDSKSFEGRFVGYGEQTKSWLIYIPTLSKIVPSRNVTFVEGITKQIHQPTPQQQKVKTDTNDSNDEENEDEIEFELSNSGRNDLKQSVPNNQPSAISTIESQVRPPEQNRSPLVSNNTQPVFQSPQGIAFKKGLRTTKIPFNLRGDYDLTGFKNGNNNNDNNNNNNNSNNLISKIDDETITQHVMMIKTLEDGGILEDNNTPTNYKEALRNPHHSKWKKAMDEEYSALLSNNTWNLTELPANKNTIKSKWVFKLKQNADGSIARYKARLVAKGYTQVLGIDYKETFAPVVKFTTIRTLTALAALRGYKIYQLDISTAYLYADADTELYMEQPEGYQTTGPNNSKLVCKLNKSIYGLKQAGRNWNKTLDSFLRSNNLEPSKADPCLYVAKDSDDRKFFAIAIYVDDIIQITNDNERRKSFINQISKKFKITDMGEIHWILGTAIETTPDNIKMHQERYILDMIKKYQMENCKPVNTPMVPDNSDANPNTIFQEPDRYRSLIGSLIFASVISRPDIAYAVGKLSQVMDNPSEKDWIAAKRVLRYLSNKTQIGPIYSNTGNNNLIGYSDSDWAGDNVGRKSTSAYVFTLAGAAISWCSKKQTIVALSSTEAEYIAASSASQEALYIRQLLKDLKYEQTDPTPLFIDNQGAITLSNNQMTNKRTKHIDVRYHFIRDIVEKKEIICGYISTEEMIADCLTKPVGHNILQRNMVEIFGINHSET